MIHPVPRPALRKSPDANLHPAAPGRPGLRLAAADRKVAPPPAPAPAPTATPTSKSGKAGKPEKQKSASKSAKSGKAHKAGKSDNGTAPASRSRLSGPLAGKTSDSLRAAPKRQRAGKKAPKEKLVELQVKVPKALRKDLRSAAKSTKRSEDAIVTALLRGWLGS